MLHELSRVEHLFAFGRGGGGSPSGRTMRFGSTRGLPAAPVNVSACCVASAKADVPALFWTAAAWAGELSMVDNPLLRIGEVATVRALFTRALELDESWGSGTIHEAMIAVEGLPALVGGSPVRAREHFKRAVELSGGHSAFAYVTLASSVSAPAGTAPSSSEASNRRLRWM